MDRRGNLDDYGTKLQRTPKGISVYRDGDDCRRFSVDADDIIYLDCLDWKAEDFRAFIEENRSRLEAAKVFVTLLREDKNVSN